MGGATAATFNSPAGLATDPAGNVYVADSGGNVVFKVTPGGVMTTLAGSGAPGYFDGSGTDASFNAPSGLAVDGEHNVYVADTRNNTIRKISPLGVVSTVLGAGGGGVGIIPGALAYGARLPLAVGYGSLVSPRGLAVTPAGDLLVCSYNALLQVTAP